MHVLSCSSTLQHHVAMSFQFHDVNQHSSKAAAGDKLHMWHAAPNEHSCLHSMWHKQLSSRSAQPCRSQTAGRRTMHTTFKEQQLPDWSADADHCPQQPPTCGAGPRCLSHHGMHMHGTCCATKAAWCHHGVGAWAANAGALHWLPCVFVPAATSPSHPKQKVKPAVPLRTEKPLMGLTSNKNYITSNASTWQLL